MSTIIERLDGLSATLRGLEGIRYYSDRGAAIDPPAVVLGPPLLRWETGCPEPTSATLLVIVAVPKDERAVPRLMELVPRVAAAVDALPWATVSRAVPGALQVGGDELPAYEIESEVDL